MSSNLPAGFFAAALGSRAGSLAPPPAGAPRGSPRARPPRARAEHLHARRPRSRWCSGPGRPCPATCACAGCPRRRPASPSSGTRPRSRRAGRRTRRGATRSLPSSRRSPCPSRRSVVATRDVGDRLAARQVARLRVAAQIADEDDLVDRCHVLPPSLIRTASYNGSAARSALTAAPHAGGERQPGQRRARRRRRTRDRRRSAARPSRPPGRRQNRPSVCVVL